MKAAAITAAAFACLAFQPQAASAQAEILMMRLCKRVQDDGARLKCFDAIGAEPQAKADESQPAEAPHWTVTESKSPIDDSAQVAATLPSMDRKAALVLRCQEKKTEAAVIFEDLFVYKQGNVLIRLNDLPAASATWAGADNNKAVFAPNPVNFIKMLPNDAALFVRVTGHSRSSDASFQLSSVSPIRERISAACGWKEPGSTAAIPSKKPPVNKQANQ